MKKVLFVCTLALASMFVACEGTEKTEDVGVGAGAAVSALEALSDTTKTNADTTAFACTCEHKCKTKEECEKNCGPECNKVK